MSARPGIPQKARRCIHIDNHNFLPSIAIQITHRQPARWPRRLKSGSGFVCHIFELAVSQIPIQNRGLQIRIAKLLAFYFGIDVPVRHNQIAPAVIIHIYEGHAPTQILARLQTTFARNICEKLAVVVMKQRSQIAGKIRLSNIQPAIAIVIGNGNAHARLQRAIEVERNARFGAALFKSAVMQIVEIQGSASCRTQCKCRANRRYRNRQPPRLSCIGHQASKIPPLRSHP